MTDRILEELELCPLHGIEGVTEPALSNFLEMVCATPSDQRALIDFTLERDTPAGQKHHIIIHGPHASGKKTLLRILIKAQERIRLVPFISSSEEVLEELVFMENCTDAQRRVEPMGVSVRSHGPLSEPLASRQDVCFVKLREAECTEDHRYKIFSTAQEAFFSYSAIFCPECTVREAFQQCFAKTLWRVLRAHWRARWIALYWHGLTAKLMAPGGRAAKRDREAFEAESYAA